MKYVLLILMLSTSVLFAEAVPFAVNGPITANDELGPIVSDLKYKAVLDQLQRLTGTRFDSFAKQLTQESAERFILDYKVGRVGPDKNFLEVSGHLDGDSMKRWLRIADTKQGASQLRPVFLLSSEIPDEKFGTNETAAHSIGTNVGATILADLNQVFQKYGAKVTPSTSVSVSSPPKSTEEARSALSSLQGNANCAVWVHFTPCASCGGARVDFYLIGIESGKKLIVKSEDFFGSGNPLQSANTKPILKTLISGIKSDLDEIVSNGTILARSMKLDVEGIDSYRTLKIIENDLVQSDLALQVVMTKARSREASFELLTLNTADEMTGRLNGSSFSNYSLKVTNRIDANHLVVRYSK